MESTIANGDDEIDTNDVGELEETEAKADSDVDRLKASSIEHLEDSDTSVSDEVLQEAVNEAIDEAAAVTLGLDKVEEEIEIDVENEFHMTQLDDEEDADDEDLDSTDRNTQREFEQQTEGDVSSIPPKSRVVTMYRSSVQRAAFLERVLQKRHLSSVSEELQRRKDHMAELKEQVTQATEFVSGLEEELMALKAEEDEIMSKPVIAKDKLSILKIGREKVTRNLQHQKHIVASREQELQEARLALRFLEVDAAEADERMKAILKLDALDVANQQQLAQTLREREQAAVKRVEMGMQEAQAASRRAEEQAIENEKQIVKNARQARKKALERLSEHQKTIRKSLAEIQLGRVQSKAKRVEALMKLKDSINDARDTIISQNKLKAEKEQKRIAAQKSEAAELLASGQNPYEVFRRRSIAARQAKEAATHDIKLRKQSIEVFKKLEREEKIYQSEKAARDVEKAYEERFEREMGLDAKEERTRLYIASITKDGRDMLDPTSRMPVQPKEVTQLKTWKFGMNYEKPDKEFMRRIQQNQEKNKQRDETYLTRSKGLATKNLGLKEEMISSAIDIDLGIEESDDTEVLPQYSTNKMNLLKVPQKTMNDFIEEGSRRSYDKVLTHYPGSEGTSGGIVFMPATVIFNDVQVGKKYTKKVNVTNISYKLNTFKLLELPPDLADVLTIDYDIDKSLGAGMACQLHLTFVPNKPCDIQSSISFLAFTGYSSLPIECYQQRADISFDDEVDFGDVPAMESKTLKLTIKNSGVLPASYVVKSATMTPSEDGVQKKVFSFERYGKINGRSKSPISITFCPVEEIEYEEELEIEFKSIGTKYLKLFGRGGKPSVIVKDSIVDFQYCVHNSVYRHGVTLINRGKVALKMKVIPRPEVEDYIEVFPSSAFIQGGGGTFTFNIKFKPTSDLMRDGSRFLAIEGGNAKGDHCIDIPMKINVPGQNPVTFRIKASLTSNGIEIAPKTLYFGNVNVGESIGQTIKITNHSHLPQSFGFVSNRDDIKMDNYGLILPHETISRTVTFSARQSSEQQFIGGIMTSGENPDSTSSSPAPLSLATVTQEFDLVCKTVFGQTYTIGCIAKIVSTPLVLSSSVVRMPSTVIGDTRYASIYIKNVTDIPQTFEFRAPSSSGIVINPSVDTVNVGRHTRIEIEYAPLRGRGDRDGLKEIFLSDDIEGDSVADMQEVEHGNSGRSSKQSPVQAPASSDEHSKMEPKEELDTGSAFFVNKWIVPCYLKGVRDQVLHLCIETCDIEKDIQIKGVELPQPGRSYGTVDFGKISTSESAMKVLEIINKSDHDIQLMASTLRFENYFTIVNQLPLLKSGDTKKLFLRFSPSGGAQAYSEMLTLSTGKQNVQINLVGIGAGRTLTIEPSHPELDMGDLTAYSKVTKEFKLINSSEIDLDYKVCMRDQCYRNRNGRASMYCSHLGGFLKAGESTSVTVTFAPDRQGVSYNEIIDFMIENSEGFVSCHNVQLSGRCWNDQMFIKGTYLDNEALAQNGPEPFYSSVEERLAKHSVNSKTLILQFSESVKSGGTAREQFEIGTTLCDGNKDLGEFKIEPLSEYDKSCGWSLDTAEGTIEAGGLKSVSVLFNPPVNPEADQLAYFGIDEWRHLTLMLTLKRGATESITHTLVVKCLLLGS